MNSLIFDLCLGDGAAPGASAAAREPKSRRFWPEVQTRKPESRAPDPDSPTSALWASGLLGDILRQKQPALPGANHIEVAVPVDVDGRICMPPPIRPAEIDDVADPSPQVHSRGQMAHPDDAQTGRRPAALVRRIAAVRAMNRLPVTKSGRLVAVQVDQRRRVPLGPRTVDLSGAPICHPSTLLEPEQAVVVARAAAMTSFAAVAVDIQRRA
mgnify:CR=1 FL=1